MRTASTGCYGRQGYRASDLPSSPGRAQALQQHTHCPEGAAASPLFLGGRGGGCCCWYCFKESFYVVTAADPEFAV